MLLPFGLHLVEGGSAFTCAARGERGLDLAEAALELAAGAAQRLFGIGFEAAREIDHREQQVADFVLDPRRRAAEVDLVAQLGDLLGDLVEDRRDSGQSKPTRAARRCSLTARVRAGSPLPTPSSALGAASAAALARRSAAFWSSQATVCAAALSIRAAPNTCG